MSENMLSEQTKLRIIADFFKQSTSSIAEKHRTGGQAAEEGEWWWWDEKEEDEILEEDGEEKSKGKEDHHEGYVYGKEEQRNTPMSDGRRLHLRLSDDNMVDDTFAQLVNLIGLHRDRDAHETTVPFLELLDVSWNHLTECSAPTVARLLEKNPGLTNLNLSRELPSFPSSALSVELTGSIPKKKTNWATVLPLPWPRRSSAWRRQAAPHLAALYHRLLPVFFFPWRPYI